MISEGQVFATWHGTHVGGTFPATLERELDAIAHRVYSDPDRNGFLHLLSRPAPSGSPRFGDVGLFASYGPGAYIPAAVGSDAGRLFGGSALVLVYLARLFQLLAYVAIVTLAVRRLPSHRWVMVKRIASWLSVVSPINPAGTSTSAVSGGWSAAGGGLWPGCRIRVNGLSKNPSPSAIARAWSS